jgi:hypothetical protein
MQGFLRCCQRTRIFKMEIGRVGSSGWYRVAAKEIVSLLTGVLPKGKGRENWRLQVAMIR